MSCSMMISRYGRGATSGFRSLAALGRGQPCCRLVEQDEAGGAGKRECDLELSLLDHAQFRDQCSLTADRCTLRSVSAACKCVVRAWTQRRKSTADTPRQAQKTFPYREAGKQRYLVGAAQAAPDTFIGRKWVMSSPKSGWCRRRRKVAGDAIEQRGLGRAVGAEHGAAFHRADRDGDVGQRASAPNSRVTRAAPARRRNRSRKAWR